MLKTNGKIYIYYKYIYVDQNDLNKTRMISCNPEFRAYALVRQIERLPTAFATISHN